jgi:hypothetical protein
MKSPNTGNSHVTVYVTNWRWRVTVPIVHDVYIYIYIYIYIVTVLLKEMMSSRLNFTSFLSWTWQSGPHIVQKCFKQSSARLKYGVLTWQVLLRSSEKRVAALPRASINSQSDFVPYSRSCKLCWTSNKWEMSQVCFVRTAPENEALQKYSLACVPPFDSKQMLRSFPISMFFMCNSLFKFIKIKFHCTP